MKEIILILVSVFSVSAFAEGPMSNLQGYSDRALLDVLASRGYQCNGGGGHGGGGLHGPRVYCTDSSTNELKNAQTGAVIFDFTEPEACAAAVESIRRNRSFCTESSTNELHTPQGGMIYDFTDPESCAAASVSIGRYGLFCTDSSTNQLYNENGQMIEDFSSPEDCARALASIH